MSNQEKPGFQITTNDASETVFIDETPKTTEAPATKGKKEGISNAATDQA